MAQRIAMAMTLKSVKRIRSSKTRKQKPDTTNDRNTNDYQ
jgi:hypothetical protein